MRKIIFSVFFAFLLPVALVAQGGGGVRIGYNVGDFVKPFHHLEILSHQFNQAFPQATNQLRPPVFARGIEVEVYGGGGPYFEMQWGNHHGIDHAKFVSTVNDSTYMQGIKYRYNTLGFGISVPLGDHILFGTIWDFGRMSVFQKFDEISRYKKKDWEFFHDYKKKGFSTGARFYFDFNADLGDNYSFFFRPYFMWMWSAMQMAEDILTENYYPATNYGITVGISIHGN